MSSVIADYSYDPLSLTLTLTFTHGESYDYAPVSPTVYAGLVAASSKGKYYNQNIKGQYGNNPAAARAAAAIIARKL